MEESEQGTDHSQRMGRARDAALLSEKQQRRVSNGRDLIKHF